MKNCWLQNALAHTGYQWHQIPMEREREREREKESERERESGYFKLLNTIFFVFKKSMLLLQPLQVNDNHFWGDKLQVCLFM